MGLLPWEREDRKVLVKRGAVTSPKYGTRPEERSTEELINRGLVVVDKPPGPTSHQVSDYLKRILGVPKAGHSGTLDPAVTGVLPVALNRATRVSHALLNAGKEYVGVLHLHADVDERTIKSVAASFVGRIKQLPPVKSAIKRQWRYRRVYYLDILEIDGRNVLFIVGCQAGTYIRKLCHDIGERIGCGAHMAELRRTKSGPFTESMAVKLQDVADAFYYYKQGDDSQLRKMLLPLEAGVAHLRKVWVLDSAVERLCHGVSLKAPGVSKVHSGIQQGELVAVMTLKDELIMIGESRMTSAEIVSAPKGVVVKPKQVFMSPGVYPRNE